MVLFKPIELIEKERAVLVVDQSIQILQHENARPKTACTIKHLSPHLLWRETIMA